MQTTDKLMEYIQDSPSPYHAAAAAARLEGRAFTRLEESAPWALSSGQCCYTTRNQSSLIASACPAAPGGLAHDRRPQRLAHLLCEKRRAGGDKRYVRLAVEGYGGMNCASWLDRPHLWRAGRWCAPRQGGRGRLVYLDRICSPSPAWPSPPAAGREPGPRLQRPEGHAAPLRPGGGPPSPPCWRRSWGWTWGTSWPPTWWLCPRRGRRCASGRRVNSSRPPHRRSGLRLRPPLEGFLSAKGTERFGQPLLPLRQRGGGQRRRQGP